jgi:FMN phosphatase YigB (HAD superfamily)
LEHPRDPEILEVSPYLIDYPFADRLYPGALDAVARLGARGTTVILTDGDAVFQPRKVQRSGLREACGRRVLIYIHKEQMLDDIESKYPAERYVMVDDKLRILAAMKQGWGNRLTAVWVVQGHYAHDPTTTAGYPAPDIRLERIAELADVGLPQLLGGSAV